MAINNDLAGLTWRLMTSLRDEANETWGAAELADLVTWSLARLYPAVSRPLPYSESTITLVTDTFVYNAPPGTMNIARIDWVNDSDEEMGPLPPGTWETVGDGYSDSLRVHISPTTANLGGTLRIMGYGRYALSAAILTTSAHADDIVDTTVAHTFTAGTPVRFTEITGGAGLLVGVTYYVIAANLASTTLQVSATHGGSAVNFTSDITAGSVSTFVPDDFVPMILAIARAEAYRRLAGSRVRYEQWAARQQNQDTSMTELMMFVNEADAEATQLTKKTRTWQKPVPARHG